MSEQILSINWPQVSIAALGGAVGTHLLALSKSWFEHFLDGRKQRAAEARAIQAEQRADARKEREQKQAEAARVKQDEAALLMLKTQLKGADDPYVMAGALNAIHDFFSERLQYLSGGKNIEFLRLYPREFGEEYSIERRFGSGMIRELQGAVDDLQIS